MSNTTLLPGYSPAGTNVSSLFGVSGILSLSVDVAFSVFVALMALFGIVANVITFLVIWFDKKLLSSPFNIMLMSLCVSDFLSSLVSPLIYYRSVTGHFVYNLSNLTCKISAAIDHWTTIATMQHMLVFVILRTIALKHPDKMKSFTSQKATILAVVIWLVTGGINGSFPMIVMSASWNERYQAIRCGVPTSWFFYSKSYMRYGFAIFYVIPMVLVVCLSVYLIFLIRGRKKQRLKFGRVNTADDKKERFAMVQLCLIVGAFLLGYIPELVFKIIIHLRAYNIVVLSAKRRASFTFVKFLLLRFSECMNPLLYNLASSTMRKSTKKFLSPRRCKRNRAAEQLMNENRSGKRNKTSAGNKITFKTSVTTVVTS